MSATAGVVAEKTYGSWSGEEGRAGRPWSPQSRTDALGKSEEAALVRRAQAGERGAMERLIQANLRLVQSVARRYHCRSYSTEDLVQEGILGLMIAVERFDLSHGCRLSTYALHWIRQAISRAADQNDRLIHIPAQTTAEMRRLRRVRDERQGALGREPTEMELAEAGNLDEERVRQLLGTVQDPVSFEALVGVEQDASLMELAEDPGAVNPEQGAVREGYRQQVRRLVSRLGQRERLVLEERYGLDGRNPRTLDELSRTLRITREGVRQIEVRAMRKLRHALRSTQWE